MESLKLAVAVTATLIGTTIGFVRADTLAMSKDADLAEILPYVSEFAQRLNLAVPVPLTTNQVTKTTRSRARPAIGIVIADRWGIGFDTSNRVVTSFTDLKMSLNRLSGDQMRDLKNTSRIDSNQAVAKAVGYLDALGYKDHPSAGAPFCEQAKWEPPGELPGLLPYFKVTWPWREIPTRRYFRMEIEGLEGRVTYFSTAYKSVAESTLNKPAPK